MSLLMCRRWLRRKVFPPGMYTRAALRKNRFHFRQGHQFVLIVWRRAPGLEGFFRIFLLVSRQGSRRKIGNDRIIRLFQVRAGRHLGYSGYRLCRGWRRGGDSLLQGLFNGSRDARQNVQQCFQAPSSRAVVFRDHRRSVVSAIHQKGWPSTWRPLRHRPA